jgi:hypothetical protein
LPSAAALDSNRVTGVDLGRADFASCALRAAADVPRFSRYNNTKHPEKMGLKKAQAKRKGWSRELHLHAALTKLPSAQTPCPFEMYIHLVKFLIILDDLKRRRRAQRMKFSRYHQCD